MWCTRVVLVGQQRRAPYGRAGRDVAGCGDRELSIIIYDASTRFHNKKEVNLLQRVGLLKSRRFFLVPLGISVDTQIHMKISM